MLLRKRIVGMSLVCILFAAFLFLGVGHAEANNSSLNGVARDQHRELVETVYSNGQIREVSDILLGTNSGFYDAMVGSDTSIGNVVLGLTKGFAAALLMLYTYISIVRSYERGEANLDMFYRVLLKLVLSFFVIAYLNDILEAIQDLGYYLVQIINNASIDALGSVDETTLEKIYDDSLWNSLSFGAGGESSYWEAQSNVLEMQSLYNPILSLLNLAIKTVSYSFFIELALRKAFMPIAMVMIMEDGPRSPGIRYLKKYFAIYLKMMFCILAVTASYALTMTTVNAMGDGFTEYVSTGFSFLYDSFATKAAALVFIRQGSMLADEILGTN